MLFLMMIKGDLYRKSGSIINDLQQQEVNILAQKTRKLSIEEASALYAGHKGKPFFDTLTQYTAMSTALLLVIDYGEEVITALKSQLREKHVQYNDALTQCYKERLSSAAPNADKFPTESEFIEGAKYLFGGIHCSDPVNAQKEIALFFDAAELNYVPSDSSQMVQMVIERHRSMTDDQTVAQTPSMFF